MKDGEVKAVTKGIVAFKHEDEIYYLSRFCTHEGADLSLGYIDEQGRLRCPWHNLCFKKDGNQPCRTLKNLKRYLKEGERYVPD